MVKNSALNTNEAIDLLKLRREAVRQWYIDSGRKAADDRLLYEYFRRLIEGKA